MGDDRPEVKPGKVLSNRVISWCAAGLVVVAAGIGWPLLAVYGLGLEAIRTVGTIVLGAGGAIGLLLAARRQQTAEQDLVEKRRDLAHKEHVQRHTEVDAAERRITELYAKAVEQLGSDKAPVRLGGLYALERLAQNTRSQRHTVVNVLCAYLRMPFDAPKHGLKGTAAGETDDHDDPELQVRLAAQELLKTHLSHEGPAYWPGMSIDLQRAVLIDFRLSGCTLEAADFSRARFVGSVHIRGTTFGRRAGFYGSDFAAPANFDRSVFAEGAFFSWAHFHGDARFTRTRSAGEFLFAHTTFEGQALFDGGEHENLELPVGV
jgi:pentapeptide repeat protein